MISSKSAMQANWDKLAEQYGSLKYSEVVPAVSKALGEAVPTHSTFYGTLGVMVAGSWLFAYAYFCVFVAGEVKRPDKTLITANFVAILVPALLMIWTAFSMYRVMPFDFISATAWIDNNGGIEGYNHAVPPQLHEPGLHRPLQLVLWRSPPVSPTCSSRSGTWR